MSDLGDEALVGDIPLGTEAEREPVGTQGTTVLGSEVNDPQEFDGSDDDVLAQSQSLSSDVKADIQADLQAAKLKDLDLSLVSDIEIPIMGQMGKVNDKRVIISGGQPLADWSGLKDPQPHRNPYQLRELFKVSTKDHKNRCEKMNTTITKETNLVTLGASMKLHFEELGIDTITYLPDPADSTNTISVLTEHAKLTKEEGTALSLKISKKFDYLDWENNGAATSILMNSLDSRLYEKLIKERQNSDTFAVVWFRLMDILYPHSISTFDNYKQIIRNRRPTDYAGQDIEELCNDFSDDAKKCSYHYDNELTMTMLETLMTAGGESNEDFKAELRPLKKSLDEALLLVRFMAPATKEKFLNDRGLSVDKVLATAEKHYRYLKNRQQWYPALSVTDKATPRTLTLAAETDKSLQSMSTAQIMALMSNIQGSYRRKGSSVKRGVCHNCGSPDHWKPDCPELKKQADKKDNSGKKSKSWRRTPPSPGQPETLTKDGRTYYWCQKCKRWTETHSTATHQVGFKKDEQEKSTNADASASLAIDPSVWFFDASMFYPVDLLSEFNEICLGVLVFIHSVLTLEGIIQFFKPFFIQHQRDIFLILLGPCFSLILYFLLAHILDSRSKSKPKTISRRSRRHYRQRIQREVKRYKRKRRSPSPPRVGRDYPFRLRQRGIYNHRSQAPSHLDQTVMNMLRELRFELIRPNRDSHRTNTRRVRPNRIGNQGSVRSRRFNRASSHSFGHRNCQSHRTGRGPMPPPENSFLCMATGSQELSSSIKSKSLLTAALQAPGRFLSLIQDYLSHYLIWDSGTSHCVTFDKKDFISKIRNPV